jgi:hypothetical protein
MEIGFQYFITKEKEWSKARRNSLSRGFFARFDYASGVEIS